MTNATAGRTAALVASLYEGHNKHEAEAVASLYSETGTHTDAAFQEPTGGRSDIQALLTEFYLVFPDIFFDVEDVLTSDDRACVRYTFHATMRKDGFGYAACGQTLSIHGVQMFNIVNGEIAATEDFWDFATFDRQLRQAI